MKQKSLKSSFVLSGKGLHTGLNITIKFNPAPKNFGYKIKRTDLPGEPVIDAVADQVCQTQRGTVVKSGDVTVSTIEHAMGALYAYGIDNCLIEVNASDFPLFDVSASFYAADIAKAGHGELDVEEDKFDIKAVI